MQFVTPGCYGFLYFPVKERHCSFVQFKEQGEKAFEKGGTTFGWQPTIDQYHRDQERSAKGLGKRVPGLRYSYVQRDCWTRLNVMPAKIMQLSEEN